MHRRSFLQGAGAVAAAAVTGGPVAAGESAHTHILTASGEVAYAGSVRAWMMVIRAGDFAEVKPGDILDLGHGPMTVQDVSLAPAKDYFVDGTGHIHHA